MTARMLVQFLVAVVLIGGLVGYFIGRSNHRGSVEIPDVRGMTIASAAQILQDRGLCVSVEHGVGPERRPIAVDQRPQPGFIVATGTLVTLTNQSVKNISSTLNPIGERNRELGCDEGIGVGGESGGAG